MLTHEQQIVAAIRKIIRAVDLHSRQLYDAHALTGPQLAVLQEIARSRAATPSSLARAVHLSQATVTGILQRLEKRNLVRRNRSEADKRSFVIEVTDPGTRLLQDAPSLLQDQFREQLSHLEHWEQLQILSVLQRVAALMGAADLDSSPYLTPGDIESPTPARQQQTDALPGADQPPH